MNTAKLLLSEKLITKSQYETAYLACMENGSTLGYHLVKANVISSKALVEFQMNRFGLKHRRKSTLGTIPNYIIRKVSSYLSNKYRVLPISASADVIVIGVTEPANHRAMDNIANHTAMTVQPVLISEEDMTWALNRYYAPQKDTSPRDTMPLNQFNEWSDSIADDEPRDTISWGVDIEDALSKAVLVSAKKTDRNLLSISPPSQFLSAPPPPDSPPTNVPPSTPPELQPSQSTNADSDDEDIAAISAHGNERQARKSISISPTSLSPDDRPTIIPEPDLDSVVPTGDGGLDSWSDTTPATELQKSAAPELRKFSSSPPKGSHRSPVRLSILPPHKGRARTEGELLHAVITTESRDEIISLALEYMLRFAGRALFLVVKKTEIRGFHIAGEFTNREAVRSFWIPFSTRSTLGQVATSGLTYLGPIGHKPADDVFCAALGGRPSHALVVPVILKNRTIGILFADRVQTQEIAWPRLNRLTEAITASLSKFILKEKEQSIQ